VKSKNALTKKQTYSASTQSNEPRGVNSFVVVLVLAIALGVVVWGYWGSRSERSKGKDHVSFFNLFTKKNQPAEGLCDYLSALEDGDREKLIKAIVIEKHDNGGTNIIVDFVIETYAVFKGFQDIYGKNLADIIGLKYFPLHGSEDADQAVFRRDGNLWIAEMRDGYVYVLVRDGKTWKVQLPDFSLNGVAMDADMALTLTAAFATAHKSLGNDLATSQEISTVLEEAIRDALAPAAEKMPKPYNTFPLHDLAQIQPQTVDPVLKSDLEAAYDRFRQSLVQKDPEALFAVTSIRKSEREILEKKVGSNDFAEFADWIAMTNPQLTDTTFITIKTDGDDFAAYYFAWTPTHSDEIQNVSVRQFEKSADGWKMLYTLSASDVPLAVASDEDLTAKIMETVETNPIIEMKRPVKTIAVKPTEPYDAELKGCLETVYDQYRQAMVDGDLDAFLSTIRASLSDENRLTSSYRKLFPEILAFYPPRGEATFVTLRRDGTDLAAYYHLIPEPIAPEFENVLLVPFVSLAGKWKILFSLDIVPRINLLAAKVEGDRIARAFELINLSGSLLSVECIGMTFEDALISEDQRDLTRALDAIERRKYEKAVSLLQPLTKKEGPPRAKTALGLLYTKGKGVGKDYHKAVDLFKAASLKGDADAFYHLGYAYFNGKGVDADQTWALAYLMAADKRGHDRAEAEVEHALAAVDEDVEMEAKQRASKLLSEITE